MNLLLVEPLLRQTYVLLQKLVVKITNISAVALEKHVTGIAYPFVVGRLHFVALELTDRRRVLGYLGRRLRE